MAKEIAISKISKISKAQQNMILCVLVASLFLGAAVSLTISFIKQITFNIDVIADQEKSIVSYSNTIRDIGICKKPSGPVYSDEELRQCDPNNIEISTIGGTLRYNILEELAANDALNSVPKEGAAICINPSNNKNYTYKELNEAYKNANNENDRKAALQKLKVCSALRIIPDALPAFKNQEALLASLNQIFISSGWSPESINPSDGATTEEQTLPAGLNPIEVRLSVKADTGTTMNVIGNIERSIREFDIRRATIEWSGDTSLSVEATATAYYADEATINESTKTITRGAK